MAEGPTNPLLCDHCDKGVAFVDKVGPLNGKVWCSEKCMEEGRAELAHEAGTVEKVEEPNGQSLGDET